MLVPKHWLLGGWSLQGMIVHQQRYWWICIYLNNQCIMLQTCEFPFPTASMNLNTMTVVFSDYFHQLNGQPWYNWNIVESGVWTSIALHDHCLWSLQLQLCVSFNKIRTRRKKCTSYNLLDYKRQDIIN